MTQDIYKNISPDEQEMLQWIRAVLFGAPKPEKPISAAVFREMQLQTLQLLVADELPRELAGTIRHDFVHNVRLLHEQNRLIKTLECHKIPVVVLKGASNAVNYPKPLYRCSGDIDIWVGERAFDEAYHVLIEEEYSINAHNGLIKDIGRPDKKHVGFTRCGISIELHKKPFILSECDVEIADAELEADIVRYMEEGLYNCEYGIIDGYSFPMLPPKQTALELLVHTKTHLRTGIGLRQIVDWMMFATGNLSDAEYQDLESVLKRYKLDHFAAVLTRMCQMYLGMPEEKYLWAMRADEKICEALMIRILRFGNFGRKEDVSAGTRAFARTPGQFVRLLQQGGQSQYREFFKKHERLKCFAWILQLGRYIRYIRINHKKLISDYKKGRELKRLWEKIMRE